jgi:hypothetical protein
MVAMGFKKRKRRYGGSLQVAIMDALEGGSRLSKKELLTRLRARPGVEASVGKLKDALGRLVTDGWVTIEGSRAAARFRATP